MNCELCSQIPENYPLKSAGPVFCAGITMYTPLKDWGALKGGLNVGIVGIGGLGQVRNTKLNRCSSKLIFTNPF